LEAIADIRMKADQFLGGDGSLSLLSQLPASSIASTFIPRLSATMHAIFSEEAQDAQAKYSAFGTAWGRKLYAAAAPIQFAEWANSKTLPAFISEILMHTPGVATTSVYYATITFVEQEGGDERKKKRIESDEDKIKKKKKRKSIPTPKASVLWGKSEITVKLKTLGGADVEVHKFSHGKFTSQEERMDYYEQVQRYLNELQVKPSIANLKAIGISQKFQRDRKLEKAGKPIPPKKPPKKRKATEVEEKVNDTANQATVEDSGTIDTEVVPSDGEEAMGTDEDEFDGEGDDDDDDDDDGSEALRQAERIVALHSTPKQPPPTTSDESAARKKRRKTEAEKLKL
jgi:hypothetical protein